MARKFFYVCGGIFLLALTYHFGAQSAVAQAPGNPVVGVSSDGIGSGSWLAVTTGGDGYATGNNGHAGIRVGNVFACAPTNAKPGTWGSVKSRSD